MSISEMLLKSNPVPAKREMSMSEYNKLVDANAKLIDKIKEQEKQIERLKANEKFLCSCITKAIDYIDNNKEYQTFIHAPTGIMTRELKIKELLKYGGIDKE